MAGLTQLPLFHNIAGHPVVVLGTGAAAEAKRRLVERAGGVVCGEADELAASARLAFVAVEGDGADIGECVERLHAAGLLINVVDRPELCDFTTPAIVDRAPVLIAVGSGGASAGLAKALRLRFEALLPARLGGLAEALAAARGAMRARWPDAAARRHALDAALGEGGVLDPLREQGEDAVTGWLEAAEDPQPARFVEIRLRSANPDDLTLGEARLLGGADLLCHEAGVPAAILARARADAARQVLGAGEVPAWGEPSRGVVVVLRSAAD